MLGFCICVSVRRLWDMFACMFGDSGDCFVA